MRFNPLPDPNEKMNPVNIDPLSFLNGETAGSQKNAESDLIQSLLHEIIRVKELIKRYNLIPNNGGHKAMSILNELISEAYDSLVKYDVMLMKKYYDLLQNCD
jgi:hypothetical protein